MATRQLLQRQVIRADPFPVPEGTQRVAKVIETPGSNVVVVRVAGATGSETTMQARLPSKFKGTVFFRTGDFVIVDCDGSTSSAVVGWVVHALHKPQVKHLRDSGLWPAEFDMQPQGAHVRGSEEDEDYLVNQNHIVDDSDDDEEEDEGEDDEDADEEDEGVVDAKEGGR